MRSNILAISFDARNAQMAIVARIGLRTLARVIHAYPTQADVIKKAAGAYVGSLTRLARKSLLRRWVAS